MKHIHNLMQKFKDDKLLLPIWFENNKIHLIDQTKLPFSEEIIIVGEVHELASAIKKMSIRGSGAIGVAGAYGVLLSAINSNGDSESIKNAGQVLKATRTTAVNLIKTIDEILDIVDNHNGNGLVSAIEEKTCEILQRQLYYEHKLGFYGAELIEDGDNILTHCNSGALAGSGYGGRALSVIRTAFDQGKRIHVYVSETRPYLQGARITAYELSKLGIPHTLITEGMSGYLMHLGEVNKVVVGSDRITANGDLINKVGTYMHALAAKDNNVPFYTATSSHTIDFKSKSGTEIKVEYRNPNEVTHINGQLIAPQDTEAIYPSFDITPNEYISGIITERGVIRKPYDETLLILNEQV